MTLDELQESLPNGLHDAELVRLSVDYAKREAVVELNIDVGNPNARLEPEDESYRPARVLFSGVLFVVVDPPDVMYDYAGVSTIDSGSGQPRTAPQKLPPVGDGAFLCWLFVSRWNSFVRIAAQSVELEWV